MSANEIRKTLTILNEMAKKPTRQDLLRSQMAQLLRGANAAWLVIDEDSDVVIFAPDERSAETLADCVFLIEEAGLDYGVVPGEFIAHLDEIMESLLTDVDRDDNPGKDWRGEKSRTEGRMSISWVPLPASRILDWVSSHNKRIPSPKEVQDIYDEIQNQAYDGEP